jgi:hypothetical protein
MKLIPSNKNPLMLTVATFSTLFGFSGVEHGLFELLQGNVAPTGLLISAIGPSQRFWLHGTEPAFTLIPNMSVTGCFAILFGLSVILWSLLGLRNRRAWLLLLFLSIGQFLTGGGFAQVFLSVSISIVASRLNTPLSWWRNRIPASVRRVLATPWLVLYVLFVFLLLYGIVVAVFGWPYGNEKPESTYSLMMALSYTMITTFILAVIASLSRQSLIP